MNLLQLSKQLLIVVHGGNRRRHSSMFADIVYTVAKVNQKTWDHIRVILARETNRQYVQLTRNTTFQSMQDIALK
jgi:hypothetical protein